VNVPRFSSLNLLPANSEAGGSQRGRGDGRTYSDARSNDLV
jgi:hypothetical protein